MREIKFRAWDKKHNHFFDVKEFGNDGSNCWASSKRGGYRHWNPIFVQYTGLKDRNGREIYEGDIIVYEIDNGVGVERYFGRVFWSENEGEYKTCFGWLIEYVNTVGFDGLSRAATYNDELEVIGNIYEDPQLLEAAE